MRGRRLAVATLAASCESKKKKSAIIATKLKMGRLPVAIPTNLLRALLKKGADKKGGISLKRIT